MFPRAWSSCSQVRGRTCTKPGPRSSRGVGTARRIAAVSATGGGLMIGLGGILLFTGGKH